LNKEIKQLIKAESKALRLFDKIVAEGFIQPGKTELELNKLVYELAKSEFRINKFWHKRIVRAGKNTLHPYKENPENLALQNDDILFLDFGPIFDQFEADIGRTYVLGNNPKKLQLKKDVEQAWLKARDYFQKQKSITGSELYAYCSELASKCGWSFGGEIAGHIVGSFPHENINNLPKDIYIHPENDADLKSALEGLEETYWIIEIHFVDKNLEIGGFYEQLAI
jgi:Xaa-Pro aminopeptidase